MDHEHASTPAQHKEWRNERIREMCREIAGKFSRSPYSIAREIETLIKKKNGAFQLSFEERFGQEHERNACGLYDIQILSQRQIRRIIGDTIMKKK